jgi:hypothetical protein
MAESVDEDNALAVERHRAERRRVRDAFLQTFGLPGQRTMNGAVILNYLGAQCAKGLGRVKIAVDNHGATDIPQTFFNMGQRDMLDLINNQIEWKEEPYVNPSNAGP